MFLMTHCWFCYTRPIRSLVCHLLNAWKSLKSVLWKSHTAPTIGNGSPKCIILWKQRNGHTNWRINIIIIIICLVINITVHYILFTIQAHTTGSYRTSPYARYFYCDSPVPVPRTTLRHSRLKWCKMRDSCSPIKRATIPCHSHLLPLMTGQYLLYNVSQPWRLNVCSQMYLSTRVNLVQMFCNSTGLFYREDCMALTPKVDDLLIHQGYTCSWLYTSSNDWHWQLQNSVLFTDEFSMFPMYILQHSSHTCTADCIQIGCAIWLSCWTGTLSLAVLHRIGEKENIVLPIPQMAFVH